MSHAPAGPKPVRIYGEPVPEQNEEYVEFVYTLFQNDLITVDELRSMLGMSPLPKYAQRPPKDIPANVPRMPEITGVRPRTECECGRDLLPTMKFCDACGRPLSYTGKTERLA